MIVGGGISGLALAHQLVQRGVDVLVLEGDARVGGKIRTDREDQFLCEAGPASFLDREAATRALLDELGLWQRAVPAGDAARRRMVVSGGTPVPVPRSPLGLITTPLLRPAAKLRVLADLVLPRGPAGQGDDESVAAFARRRLGREATTRLFYPLVSGLYAGDPGSISLPSSFPWLAGLERDHRSLIVGLARELGARQRKRDLLSFPRGMDELPERLAERLGPRLRRSARVTRIDPLLGQYRLTVEENGRQDELLAPLVALAVPAFAASSIVAGMAPRASAALAAIPYAPVVLVHVGYPSDAFAWPLDSYGFLVPPGERSRLVGATFPSALYAGRAPDGKVLISARLGGMRDPSVLDVDDAELAALVARELRTLMGARGQPCFTHVVRHERALPQYTLGHRLRLDLLDATEQAHPGLYFTGNAYRGLGVPDCIANAIPLADRVARAAQAAQPPARAARVDHGDGAERQLVGAGLQL